MNLHCPTSSSHPAAATRCHPLPRSVIHQPSSEVFALFDKLCLLSDGHVVYFGAAGRAAGFFEQAGLGVPANRNPGAQRCRVARGGALGTCSLPAMLLHTQAETAHNTFLPAM